MPKHETHNFTLVLTTRQVIDDEFAAALYEAGCDDATLSVRAGVPFLEFHRRAASFAAAVVSAFESVGKAELDIAIHHMEPSDLVSMAEIARRLSKSRECVRLWTQGKRGVAQFPPPVSGYATSQMTWSWADVVEVLAKYDKITDPSVIQRATSTRIINLALSAKRYGKDDPRLLKRVTKKIEETVPG